MSQWKFAENALIYQLWRKCCHFLFFLHFSTFKDSDGIVGVSPDQTFYFYHWQPRVPLRLTTMWWQQLWLHTDTSSSTGCPNVPAPRRALISGLSVLYHLRCSEASLWQKYRQTDMGEICLIKFFFLLLVLVLKSHAFPSHPNFGVVHLN